MPSLKASDFIGIRAYLAPELPAGVSFRIYPLEVAIRLIDSIRALKLLLNSLFDKPEVLK